MIERSAPFLSYVGFVMSKIEIGTVDLGVSNPLAECPDVVGLDGRVVCSSIFVTTSPPFHFPRTSQRQRSPCFAFKDSKRPWFFDCFHGHRSLAIGNIMVPFQCAQLHTVIEKFCRQAEVASAPFRLQALEMLCESWFFRTVPIRAKIGEYAQDKYNFLRGNDS